jgi:hypothetical protein
MDKEEMQAKILDWASQLELDANVIEDPTVDLRIVLSEARLPPIQVVHPKADSKYVVVVSVVSLSEEDHRKLVEMAYKKLEKLFWEIRFKLLNLGVDFKILRPEKIPTAWEIHSKLFLEEARVQDFFETYTKIKNSVFCVIWSHRQTLDLME